MSARPAACVWPAISAAPLPLLEPTPPLPAPRPPSLASHLVLERTKPAHARPARRGRPSYFADSFSPANRASGFGIVLACFSGAIIIGPKLGSVLPTEVALWLSVFLGMGGLLVGVLFLPETVTPAHRAAALASRVQRAARAQNMPPAASGVGRCGDCRWASGCTAGLRDFLDSALILKRDRFFLVLAMVAAADGAAVQGMQDVSLFYLKGTFAADVAFRGSLLQAVGFGGLVLQGFALRPLVGCLRERGLLILGLACTAAFIALYGVLGHALVLGAVSGPVARSLLLWLVVPLNAFAMVTFPALSALKANHASEEEQGQVQGALNGARGLATGLGPVLTAQLWRALPAQPYIVYYCLCACVCVALLLATATLPRSRPRGVNGAGFSDLGGGGGRERKGPPRPLQEPLLDSVAEAAADAEAAAALARSRQRGAVAACGRWEGGAGSADKQAECSAERGESPGAWVPPPYSAPAGSEQGGGDNAATGGIAAVERARALPGLPVRQARGSNGAEAATQPHGSSVTGQPPPNLASASASASPSPSGGSAPAPGPAPAAGAAFPRPPAPRRVLG